MPACQALIDARQAVEAIRPLEAMQFLEKFRTGFDASRVGPQEAVLIEVELRNIRNLSEGALQGIAQARELVRQLNELSRGIGTYDREGKRLTHPVTLPEARTF